MLESLTRRADSTSWGINWGQSVKYLVAESGVATKELADAIGMLGPVVSVKPTDEKARRSELLVARACRLTKSVAVVWPADDIDGFYATVAFVRIS